MEYMSLENLRIECTATSKFVQNAKFKHLSSKHEKIDKVIKV